MKKHPKKISKATEELFANADIPDVPVLLSKSRVHDSIAVAVGSFVMAGQHMRNAAASMNMGFKVKSRVHDSIAAAAGSFVVAGQHMRNVAASMNMGFKVKSRRGFKITKKVMRHARKWKKCKA